MSSIFPQIKTLENIPDFHRRYAKFLLSQVINKALELGEIDIGVDTKGNSQIRFDADEFENVYIEIRCKEYHFEIAAVEDSEDFNTSLFKYKITDNDADLYSMIPEKLRDAMENVADSNEPILLKYEK